MRFRAPMVALLLATNLVNAQPAPASGVPEPNISALGRPEFGGWQERALADAWSGRLAALAPLCGQRDAAWGRRFASGLKYRIAGPEPDVGFGLFMSDQQRLANRAYIRRSAQAEGAVLAAVTIAEAAHAQDAGAACRALLSADLLPSADTIAGTAPTQPPDPTIRVPPASPPALNASATEAAANLLAGMVMAACGRRPARWWLDLGANRNDQAADLAVILANTDPTADARTNGYRTAASIVAVDMIEYGGRQMLLAMGKAACASDRPPPSITKLDASAARGQTCRMAPRRCASASPDPLALSR